MWSMPLRTAYRSITSILHRLIYIVAALLLTACDNKTPPQSSIEVARNGIHGGALSSDGEYAVIGSVFHGGSLWRTKDGERLYNWNHSENEDKKIIISGDIEADNQWAMTADAATLVLWDMNTGEYARFWTSPGEVLDTKLSKGGRYALLGLADHSAVIFDAIRGGISRTFTHQGRVRSVDLSDDGRVAITGSEDQTAVVWQIKTGKALFTVQHREDVQLVKLSSDGRYALTAAQYDRAEIWDVEQQKSLGVIPLAKAKLSRGLRLTTARFSEDNRYILLGFPNRTVELRETRSFRLVKTWGLPKRNQWQPTAAAVIDVAFDANKNRYWSITSDGFIHLLK